jgi:hypothetical protein
MAPVPGAADGVDPAAGANRAGGVVRAGGTCVPLNLAATARATAAGLPSQGRLMAR